jgi:hypothetical protein
VKAGLEQALPHPLGFLQFVECRDRNGIHKLPLFYARHPGKPSHPNPVWNLIGQLHPHEIMPAGAKQAALRRD